MRFWEAAFKGKADTPYEGGVWILKLILPPDYPFKPPKFCLITKIYHPQVHGG